MSLFDSIQKDFISARKSRDTFMSKVLSMLVSDIKYEKINGSKEDIDDELVISVVQKSIKQKKEALAEFEKAERDDLVKEAQDELAILEKYQPEQLSESKIREIAFKAKETLGANSPSDMGKLMKEVMSQVKGQADGKTVKDIVSQILNS
jgi:hypothetical protein